MRFRLSRWLAVTALVAGGVVLLSNTTADAQPARPAAQPGKAAAPKGMAPAPAPAPAPGGKAPAPGGKAPAGQAPAQNHCGIAGGAKLGGNQLLQGACMNHGGGQFGG